MNEKIIYGMDESGIGRRWKSALRISNIETNT